MSSRISQFRKSSCRAHSIVALLAILAALVAPVFSNESRGSGHDRRTLGDSSGEDSRTISSTQLPQPPFAVQELRCPVVPPGAGISSLGAVEHSHGRGAFGSLPRWLKLDGAFALLYGRRSLQILLSRWRP